MSNTSKFDADNNYELDNFTQLNDVSESSIKDVKQYQHYISNENFSSANTLYSRSTELQKCTPNASWFNKVIDALHNCEVAIKSKIKCIKASSTQPTDQARGDIWLKQTGNNVSTGNNIAEIWIKTANNSYQKLEISQSAINNFPTSMKNPCTITIQVGGNAIGTYDGSSNKVVNIDTYTKNEVDDIWSEIYKIINSKYNNCIDEIYTAVRAEMRNHIANYH